MKDRFDLTSLDDARLLMINKIESKDYSNKDFSLKVLKRIEELMIEASAVHLINNGELHPDLEKIKNWKKKINKPTNNNIDIEERELLFRVKVAETNKQSTKMENASVSEFINYWTEKNKSETKMKWEMQQTFQISRRLLTWKRNSKNNFKSNKSKLESKFKKTSTGYFIAYCSKCGNKELPTYDWQIRNGSSCCAVEYLPERSVL
tara:strand:+ start:1698 stop:2315 length:618 start_codon:yes stop_codon:yes gene_type:complete